MNVLQSDWGITSIVPLEHWLYCLVSNKWDILSHHMERFLWSIQVLMPYIVRIVVMPHFYCTGVGMPTQLIPLHFNLLNTMLSSRPVIQISWWFDGIDGGTLCVFRMVTDICSNSSLETAQSNFERLVKRHTWWEVWESERTRWEDKAFLGG